MFYGVKNNVEMTICSERAFGIRSTKDTNMGVHFCIELRRHESELERNPDYKGMFTVYHFSRW